MVGAVTSAVASLRMNDLRNERDITVHGEVILVVHAATKVLADARQRVPPRVAISSTQRQTSGLFATSSSTEETQHGTAYRINASRAWIMVFWIASDPGGMPQAIAVRWH